MAVTVEMRAYDPVGETYVYWTSPDGYDATGLYYTGPPVFGTLVGVTAISSTPGAVDTVSFWAPTYRETQNRDVLTENQPSAPGTAEGTVTHATPANAGVIAGDGVRYADTPNIDTNSRDAVTHPTPANAGVISDDGVIYAGIPNIDTNSRDAVSHPTPANAGTLAPLPHQIFEAI